MRGLSPVAASGGHSSSRYAGLSPSRPLLLRSTGSRRAGSVVVAHGPSCSAACGIFPDQGSNPCLLHWQADSQPLRHQGSPHSILFFFNFWLCWIFTVAHGLSSCGSRALERRLMAHGLSCSTACGSSWTRDRTCVACIGRRILNHCPSGKPQ